MLYCFVSSFNVFDSVLQLIVLSFQPIHSVLPPWDQGGGGGDFCVISQAGGATAKLHEPGWGHIQGGGGDDFR